jgi:hypothetical protein
MGGERLRRRCCRGAIKRRTAGPTFRPARAGHRGLAGIAKIRALQPAKLYLPHFGLVKGDIAAHLDALEERVRRWSLWFRDRIRAGDDEQKMTPAFAEYVADELRGAGATEAEVIDYEHADPSFMAVSAAMRYWRKHHPEEVEGQARTESYTS